MEKRIPCLLTLTLVCLILAACQPGSLTPQPDRERLIPGEQTKFLPETDLYPPRSLNSEYADPVPLPYPVNTAGAEDSAFILPDGKTLYLWFTPDPNAPLEDQLTDGVTGIYRTQRTGDGWSEPGRVLLQDPGRLALDGCGFVLDDLMYFCSAREGYTGLRWFTAHLRDRRWSDWTLADFPESYQVGELHLTADGQELYFHSNRPGGLGAYDLWVSQWQNSAWGEPTNLTALNSSQTDGWPFVTADGDELWFTRGDGAPELWRSLRVDGTWSAPQRMFAPFAGEATLDEDGNVYFTHHFFQEGVMLEADIYVAEKIGE